VICFAQGLFLPLTRLFEPFFYAIVAKKIKEYGCPCRSSSRQEQEAEKQNDMTFLKRGMSRRDIRESDYSSNSSEGAAARKMLEIPAAQDTVGNPGEDEEMELQPLFLMLASSLNVELVYVILKSIT